MNPRYEHKPVLLKEVCDNLVTDKSGIYVDCTTGLGGHSAEILKRLSADGKLVAIDRDADSLAKAKERLGVFKDRVLFAHSSYSDLRRVLSSFGIEKANGILFDLGYSSYQIDDPLRGFSFAKNGPLDMRYDRTKGITAARYIEKADFGELSDVIEKYGEEKNFKKAARAIIEARARKNIQTTQELAEILRKALGGGRPHGRIDPATKVFQALRIAVNKELEHLEVIMEEIAESLISKGRMAVISFHSLEDKIVKEFVFNNSRGCTCTSFMPKCVCGHKKVFNVITQKVIRPSAVESAVNPRARSARLRIAERI